MKKIKKLYGYDKNKKIYKYNHNFYFFEILKIYLYPEFWKDRVKIIEDSSLWDLYYTAENVKKFLYL
jgi:hypothetical protein